MTPAAVLSRRQRSTRSSPSMLAWMVQRYSIVPASSKLRV